MLCSPPSPASVVIVETVPKVLLPSVPVGTSSLSFGHINTIAASLFVKDVLFVWESSFIVSGVLPVTSFPLPSCLFLLLVLQRLALASILLFSSRRCHQFDQVSLDQHPLQVQSFIL